MNTIPRNYDARIIANQKIKDELGSTTYPPSENSDPFAAIHERACMETPNETLSIVEALVPDDYRFKSGYALGHYVSKYILPIPGQRNDAMRSSTQRIVTELHRRSREYGEDSVEDSPAQDFIFEITGEYDIPSIPSGNALIAPPFETEIVLRNTFQKIAEGHLPETRALSGLDREKAIKKYLAGVGLAQMATEEAWYTQSQELKEQFEQITFIE